MSLPSNFVKISDDVYLHFYQTTPAGVDLSKVPILIFLHFWGGSANTWSYVVRSLSPSFPAIALSFVAGVVLQGKLKLGLIALVTLPRMLKL